MALGHEVEGARLALPREHVPSRGIQIEQDFAGGRVAHQALRPGDGHQPLASGHRPDAMERAGRVGHRVAGVEPELLIAHHGLQYWLPPS